MKISYVMAEALLEEGWCYIENDNDFERNENRATVFLKWTDFSDLKILGLQPQISKVFLGH